jgi:hypothetical protein
MVPLRTGLQSSIRVHNCVDLANALAGTVPTIVVGCSTFRTCYGLSIARSVTIRGICKRASIIEGSSGPTVDAPMFEITSADVNVTFTGLTLRNHATTGTGGAIRSLDLENVGLTLTNVIISNIAVDTGLSGTSFSGAVLHNQQGEDAATSGFLHITGSTLTNNTGSGAAAVYVRRVNTFKVSTTTFSRNVLQAIPSNSGGAAFTANRVGQAISLNGVTFTRNSVVEDIIGLQSATAFMAVVPASVEVFNTVFSNGVGVGFYIINTQPPTTYANLNNVKFTNNRGQC